MIKTKLFNHAEWPKTLAFFVLMASGTFVVFSNFILKYWYLSSAEMVFIYILPWFMMWPFLSYEVVLSKQHRIEFLMMALIIILGFFNANMSDNMFQSFPAMRSFILSGIIPLWISMFVISEDKYRILVYYICCGWLLIIGVTEIINYLFTDNDLVFIYHTIPLGTLIILLFIGPLYLLVSASKKLKLFSIFVLTLGLIVVALANKRGTFLSIGGMALAWIYYRYIRGSAYIIILLFASIVGIFAGWQYYKSLDKDIPYHNSILHRLELYPFSFHIYQKHPFFGTGLRAFSHNIYLKDYQMHNKSLDSFGATVNKLQTFDNMIVTGLVEMGSIMTICYLGLIFYIISRYCWKTQPFSLNHQKAFILLLPLLGLAIHSMTYDSLIFPQINWLFHVQLGILAGYSTGEHEGPASPMQMN